MDDSTESIKSGPTLLQPRRATSSPAIANLPETRRLVVLTALDALLGKKYFDICGLNDVMEITQSSRDTEAYRLLHALHCVHYSNMAPELRDSIPRLINEALRPRGIAREVVDAMLDGVPL